ncbi:MAG: hypothetical protein JWP13_958 [Candidatus Saccharibacteria bacterium]|nr:hypothetical protein [Candidatus Saccharibacteria bacterium]
MLSLEVIDFNRQNPLAVAAAGLITMSIYPQKNINAAIERYIIATEDEGYTSYGLVENNQDLVAAASVVHGEDYEGQISTQVVDIAVSPDRYKRGYGLKLMGFIAEQAIRQGDASIHLFSLDRSKGFYEKLGFSEDMDRHNMMTAQPATVIAAQYVIADSCA